MHRAILPAVPGQPLRFKVIMLGDSGVGKSCIMLRYTSDAFSQTFITTLAIDFQPKEFVLDGRTLRLTVRLINQSEELSQ
jgi:GTPase SAR1 family protein